MDEKISRKGFIKKITLLSAGCTGFFVLYRSLLPLNSADAAEKIVFIESECGKEKKGRVPETVLVAYASEFGSTSGVAEAIGNTLCKKGYSADVRRISGNGSIKENLSTYDAVIFGAPLQKSKWLPEMSRFLEKYKDTLATKPTAAFVTCLELCKNENDKKKQASVLKQINPALKLVPEVKPKDIGLFAGELNYSKYNFILRKIMQSMMKKRGVKEGDYRNWSRIRKWSRQVAVKL